jgi:hypothetical protein
MTETYRAPEPSHRYVLDLVRGADRDRFLAALFAPEPERPPRRCSLSITSLPAPDRHARTPCWRASVEWWREAVAEAAGTASLAAQPIVESLRKRAVTG